MNIPNVFNTDAFTDISMTAFVNKIDYTPGRIREMGLFTSEGIETTKPMIEEFEGQLTLVPATPRGAPPAIASEEKRKARLFNVTHLQKERTINSESVQDVRAHGSQSLETWEAVVKRYQKSITRDIEATIENLCLGALTGVILDADGSTEIYNLFTEFEVAQLDEVDFELDDANTDVRMKCQAIRRSIAKELGAYSQGRFQIHAFCGDTFYDALIGHADVKTAYERWQVGSALREDYTYDRFQFAGIVFENYRGSDDGTSIAIDVDKAIIFPRIPEIYQLYFGPADFLDSVNQVGLPLYSRLALDKELNRWAKVHVQSNPLPLCTIPRVLMKAKRC